MKSSIYFITDCHFSEKTIFDNKKVRSLGLIIKNDPNRFIYLAVSGDIAYSGKSIEYQLFLDFFEKLKQISEKEIRLITCPGNHDINFGEEEYSLASLKNDIKKENIEEAYKNRISKMASYKTFERLHIQAKEDDNYLSHITFSDDEKEIVFYLLNNVLFSCFGRENRSDDTKNFAYLSETSVYNIKRTNPNQIVFLLMHFPIDYFNDEMGHFFKERISKNVDVILNGHLHVPEKEMYIGKGDVTVLQGDYFSKGNLDDSGSFIKIDLNKKQYTEFKWDDDSYIEQEKEYSLTLCASRWNEHGISINNDYYLQLSKCEIFDKKLNINDIFVFPYICKEKYDNFMEKESTIKDFPSFLSRVKKNPYIFIYGDDGSGKTSLSKYLTLMLFNENYFPVLCDGSSLLKVKDFSRFIKRQIKEMYSEKAVSKFNNEVDSTSKVLIIDDFSKCDSDFLCEANKVFMSIIAISRLDDKELINKPTIVNDIEILEYTIQPMVKSKRREFTYKLYDALINLGENSALTKEKFFFVVEKQLSTLAINDICDPISLAYIEINAFRSSDSFDNTLFSNVNQARSLLTLNDVIRKNKYNCSIDSINRIISHIAYSMFRDSKQEFSMIDIENAIDCEVDNYGEPGIKEYDISQLMLEALIAKELKNRNLTFFNRDIFSYYIALFINIQIGDGDNSYFIDLLERDIFIPLNFNILMCLSSIYKNPTIPYKIINLIFDQAKGMPLLNEQNFSIAGIKKEKKEELEKLTREDIIKINERQDEIEKKKHESYLKNKDNLYYVDIVSPEVKDINVWLDKLKVCCVLLKNFSTTIKKPYKEKLIDLIVSLPNLVLYKFNDYLFKELDNLYALLKNGSTNTKLASSVEAFNNFIVSTKRAFILTTYDYGSRCFTDHASKELLKESIEDSDSELKIVQNLMFKSFIIHGNSFIQSCTELINNRKYKETSFIKVSARLIGRRYIVENFELCNKSYKSFVNLIFKSPKEALQYKAFTNSKK